MSLKALNIGYGYTTVVVHSYVWERAVACILEDHVLVGRMVTSRLELQ